MHACVLHELPMVRRTLMACCMADGKHGSMSYGMTACAGALAVPALHGSPLAVGYVGVATADGGVG